MAEKRFAVSRRAFLKGSTLSVAALALSDRALDPVWQGLTKLGVPTPWYRQSPIKTTYNYCDMCPWRCGVIVQSVNGRVVKIDGNPKDPKSRGMLCGRGQAGVSFTYDPDRLTQPLIRTGARGEGQFRKASWSEALDYTAEKLNKIKDEHGPEGVAFFGHTSGDFWFTDYLPQAWGSPNAAKPSMSLCTSPREEAALLTFGRSIGNHEPVDWDAARCIVLIGTHIGEDTRNTTMQDFANARGRGAQVIVVDPRFSSAGMKADTWLPIKPGTDIALLLAWMNVLIGENLYDREFVERWTVGFDRLAAHVKPFTPEWAAPMTDIPADQIRAAARVFGAARPQAVIVPGRHVTWYGDDSQRMRAVYILNALVGALGRPGGLYFNKPPFVDEHSHPPYAVTGGAGG
ncbi:MAG: molybdopterin-dependent oxidoreductase [Anaerolineae bacterium]